MEDSTKRESVINSVEAFRRYLPLESELEKDKMSPLFCFKATMVDLMGKPVESVILPLIET
jgi:hypothetical protein